MTKRNLGEAPEAATQVDAGAHEQLFYEEILRNIPNADIWSTRCTPDALRSAEKFQFPVGVELLIRDMFLTT